jgi:PKD repeat protein
MRWPAIVLLLAVFLPACGSSHPTSPSTPPSSTTPPSTSAGPSLKIDVKADAAGSRDAIASLSEVLVDAGGSTGTGLTYAIDFGDGVVAATATARHVYAAAGSYTITGTVTDAQGRKASDTRPITVKAAIGNWFQAGYVAKTARVEIRRLSIVEQTGTTVRGSYRVTGDVDRAVMGTLVPPRDIRIVAGAGVLLEGTLPGRVNDEGEDWPLVVHGDSADGQRLAFRAIAGDPSAPPPDADLKVSYDGNPWAPIAGLTAVHIDGAASRGTGLQYFSEFGDGFVAAESRATRVVDVDTRNGNRLTARLTVVDRFGRSDAEQVEYSVFDLGASGPVSGDYWLTTSDSGGLRVFFTSRSGRTYGGWVFLVGTSTEATVSATVSGQGDMQIAAPALGIEYRGRVVMGASYGDTRMILVQSGGADNGRTWTLSVRSYY